MSSGPPLPPGRIVDLPGRGSTFVREVPAPVPTAPTVVLLHGWTANADLNWFSCFGSLGRYARIVAPASPSAQEIESAASIAARLGYETAALSLPLVVHDNDGDELKSIERPIFIGRSNAFVKNLDAGGVISLKALKPRQGLAERSEGFKRGQAAAESAIRVSCRKLELAGQCQDRASPVTEKYRPLQFQADVADAPEPGARRLFLKRAWNDELGSHRNAGRSHVSILDDHDHVSGDKVRFSSEAASDHQVVAGVAIQLFSLGIPCVYYGTEQAFSGPEKSERDQYLPDYHAAERLPPITHAFSHYRLELQPLHWRGVEMRSRVADNADLRWVGRDQFAALGIPAPIRTLIEET